MKNFKYLGLQIDYLTFNIPSNDLHRIQTIADYLFHHYNISSILLNEKTQYKKVFYPTTNFTHTAYFHQGEIQYWTGTSLKFKGPAANHFYNMVKKNKLNPEIFRIEFMTIGRIDICYDRELNSRDLSFTHFLEKSSKRLYTLNNPPHFQYNPEKQSLKIYKRKNSNQHFRVYLRDNGKDIRFELELTRKNAKLDQQSFFLSQFDVFEEKLARTFYREINKNFNLNDPFLAGSLQNFRILQVQPILDFISLSYLTKKSFLNDSDLEYFYQLIQLLNFLKNLESSKESLAGATYRTIEFPVYQFLEYTGRDKNNNYQLKKLLLFFRSLQDLKPLLSHFHDGGFRSLVVFPVIEVTQRRAWFVKLSILDKYFNYPYPFSLPNSFLIYKNKNDLKIKYKFIESFSQKSIQKTFSTQELFSTFSLSNASLTKHKKQLIIYFNILQESNLIKPEYTIIFKNNKSSKVYKLTSNLISRSKLILFEEKLHL